MNRIVVVNTTNTSNLTPCCIQNAIRMLAVNGDETDEAKMTFEEFFKISKKNAQVSAPVTV